MAPKLDGEDMYILLRGLVQQVQPEIETLQDVPQRIKNLLSQKSMSRHCCAEVLAYYTFPSYNKSFEFLRTALLSGGLKDSEIKKLISKLPEDKKHLFEPLLGVRAFDFNELAQMEMIPFSLLLQTLNQFYANPIPSHLIELYQKIPEGEKTHKNQQKLGDIVAYILLLKTVRFCEDETEIKTLQHLLQHLPEWKPKK